MVLNYLENKKSVCWTVLVSNEPKLLSEYLERLLAQDYEKKLIHLYIVASDNKGVTGKIIEDFIETSGSAYSGVTYVKDPVHTMDPLGSGRETVSGSSSSGAKRRQMSVDFANQGDFGFYFVSDVSNLLTSKVLSELVKLNLPIVAPLLMSSTDVLIRQTNFHEKNSPSGELLESARHSAIVSRELIGVFQVDLVKDTYLVKHEVLRFIDYSFSDVHPDHQNFALSLLYKTPLTRQFLDARQYWGAFMTDDFHETSKELILRLEEEVVSFSNTESERESLIAQNAYFKKKVVSLSSFVERHMRFRYDNLHLVFDFVFDHGQEIAETRNNYPSLRESTSNLKIGSIDRALAHIRLLEEAVEKNETVIILEDDVKLHKDFDRILDGLLSKQSPYDTLLLGFNWDSMIFVREHDGPVGIVKQSFNQRGLLENWRDIESLVFSPVTKRLLIGWGLCATLTTPQGAQRVLEHLRNFQPEFFDYESSPVRFAFNSFDSIMNAVYKDLESYVVTPPIAWVQNGKTTSTIWNS